VTQHLTVPCNNDLKLGGIDPIMESMRLEKNAERSTRSPMSVKWMVWGMLVTHLEEGVVYRSWRCWWMVVETVGED